MALECKQRVIALHATAIITDFNKGLPPLLKLYRNLSGSSIDGVIHQLAHHRGRPLHHFASGDLADQLVGQFQDGPPRGGLRA